MTDYYILTKNQTFLKITATHKVTCLFNKNKIFQPQQTFRDRSTKGIAMEKSKKMFFTKIESQTINNKKAKHFCLAFL